MSAYLYVIIKTYPVLMMIPLLNLPIVSNLLVNAATNIVVKLPCLLIKKTYNISAGMVEMYKGNSNNGNIKNENENENENCGPLRVAIFRDSSMPEWENIEIL